jgi:hypothetical protein
MPQASADTLEQVVKSFPADISARAELLGFYSERWRRKNVLGFDPECLNKLVSHFVWCIKHVPYAEVLGTHRIDIRVNASLAPVEHEKLASAWERAVELRPDDPTVLASAGAFFNSVGKKEESASLLRKAKELAGNEAKVHRIIQNANWSPWSEDTATEERAAKELSERAIENDLPCPLGPAAFSLLEWSKELDLCGAHLEGVYHWYLPNSIDNLDAVMPTDSTDMYNRAKIIGCFDKYYMSAKYQDQSNLSLSEEQKERHVRHMVWFIENVPACRFVGLFYLQLLKLHAPASYKEIKTKLLQVLEKSPTDQDIQISVAAALSETDKKIALTVARKLRTLQPAWSERLYSMLGTEESDPDARAILAKHQFKPGRRSAKLSKIATDIDLVGKMI